MRALPDKPNSQTPTIAFAEAGQRAFTHMRRTVVIQGPFSETPSNAVRLLANGLLQGQNGSQSAFSASPLFL